jgi:deoxyribodipyrimidine photo-lyase
MTSALVWLRRDLRLYDQAALHHALKQHPQVWVCFIFDTTILNPLLSKSQGFDRRVDFIWQTIEDLDQTLRAQGGGIIARHGNPTELIPALAKQLGVQAVFTNHDYEHSAILRDEAIAQKLVKDRVGFQHFKDQVIFEKSEVLTNSETVFSVFTPYKNAWLKKLNPSPILAYRVDMPPFPRASTLASLRWNPWDLDRLV